MKTFEFLNRKNIILLIVTTLCSVITISKISILVFYLSFLVLFFVFSPTRTKLIQLLSIFNLSFLYIQVTNPGYLKMNYHIYYPSILTDSLDIFQSDYTASFTYPYTAFKFFSRGLFNNSFLRVSEILNILTIFFSVFILFLFLSLLFEKSYPGGLLFIFFMLTTSYQKLLFIEILSLDTFFNNFIDNGRWFVEHLINLFHSFINGGFAHYRIISDIWQPQFVTILLIPTIYYLSKSKFVNMFLLLSVSVLFNTNNLVVVLLFFLTILYINKQNTWINVLKPNLIPLIILFISISYVSLYSITNLSPSDKDILIDSDEIMSEYRIPNHLKANSSITFLNLITYDLDSRKVELGGNYPGDNGFPFELEIFLFYLMIIKFSKSKELNIFFTFGLIAISCSFFYTFYFPKTILAIYLKNFAVWKTSILFYIFGSTFLLRRYKNFFNSQSIVVSLSVLIIFLTTNYSSSFVLNANLNNENLENIYINRLFVTSPSDNNLSFKYYMSTTGSYYAHPYNPNEIVLWWEKMNYIESSLKTLQCSETDEFIKKFGAEGIVFSSRDYLPLKLEGCSNLQNENDLYVIYLTE